MKNIFIALTLLCLVGEMMAIDCNNPLLSSLSVTGVKDPIDVTSLQYCKGLQTTKSCCTADTVNGFQTRTNDLVAKLVPLVSARDKFIVDTRDKFMPTIQDGLKTLQTKSKAAYTKLGGKRILKTYDTTQALAVVTSISALTTKLLASLPTTADLLTYQQSRAKCFNEMIAMQAAAWCLSCDPTYNSRGVDTDSSIILDPATCTRLQASCYDFISQTSTHSLLLSARTLSASFTQLNTALDGISDANDANDADSLQALATILLAIPVDNTANSASTPVDTPDTCTSKTTCPWVCETLMSKGTVDQSLLLLGGTPGSGIAGALSTTGRRVRLLAPTGSWSPAADEAGVTVNFPTDPGQVTTKSSTNGSKLMEVSIVCFIGLLINILL